jgi:lysophospholipase L1-like esterase
MIMRCVLISAAALVALVLCAPTLADSQTSPTAQPRRTWDFPGHFKKRLAAMEADVASLPHETTGVVVLLGDSLTEGNKIKQLCGRPVVNMGVSGDQIQIEDTMGVRNRLDVLERAKPADIFLLIGINDFGSSKPLETAEQQYADLVSEIGKRMPNAKLHIQSVLPTSGRFAFHLPNVRAINEYLKHIASESEAEYIDLFSKFADEKGELRADYTTEGLHLTPAAYETWNAILQERLGCSGDMK